MSDSFTQEEISRIANEATQVHTDSMLSGEEHIRKVIAAELEKRGFQLDPDSTDVPHDYEPPITISLEE